MATGTEPGPFWTDFFMDFDRFKGYVRIIMWFIQRDAYFGPDRGGKRGLVFDFERRRSDWEV